MEPFSAAAGAAGAAATSEAEPLIRDAGSPTDGVDLAELASVLPPVPPPWTAPSTSSLDAATPFSATSVTPPAPPQLLPEVSSLTVASPRGSGIGPIGGGGEPPSGPNLTAGISGISADERKRIQFADHLTEPSDASSAGSTLSGGGSGGGEPPTRGKPGRQRKSIRIILDDEEKEPGSLMSMLERKIRFEESPTTPVTPLDSKGSAASNDTSMFDDKLRLLSVSDAMTGMCLFKIAWNWRKNTNVDGVGSLVQSFYQFAREVGDGGLNYISFELPARRSHHRHTPRKRLQMQRSQASMALLTCRDACCVVALFYDDRQLKTGDPETEDLLRAYMEAVKQRFGAVYSAKVESLRPTLRDITDGKNQTLQASDIQSTFQDFEKTALELREQLLPNI